jgi:hypothetical protein
MSFGRTLVSAAARAACAEPALLPFAHCTNAAHLAEAAASEKRQWVVCVSTPRGGRADCLARKLAAFAKVV